MSKQRIDWTRKVSWEASWGQYTAHIQPSPLHPGAFTWGLYMDYGDAFVADGRNATLRGAQAAIQAAYEQREAEIASGDYA